MADTSTALVPAEWYAEVPRSIRKHVIFSMLLLCLSFGGFGFWAFMAPLAAAVIAQGSFVATGQNSIVQHLEGGIIKSILINEGDMVEAGQPIVLLDNTAAIANERELFLRQVRLETIEARIMAEYNQVDRLIFPENLERLRSDAEIAAMMDGQTLAFQVSKQALENDVTLLRQNIEALEVRSRGYALQLQSTLSQQAILKEDMADKEDLLARGLTRRVEANALRRALAETEGQAGKLQAEIDEIDRILVKYATQIEQTLSEKRNAVLDELQAVQAELDSVREQFSKAQNVLQRSAVVSPVTGTVVRLYYNTLGGVVESGKAIAEILPADVPLIIELQIPRTEIDVVQKGQPATVRLTGLNQRTTPVLNGEVYYVSADAIVERSKEEVIEVYIARVSLSRSELDRVRGFQPTPGMPAQIMIQTEERTFFQYISKPITDSMQRAFREQ